MNTPTDTKFLSSLWDYYTTNGRHSLPWRLTEPSGQFDAYKILVSESMLQQTQVERVIPKFLEFMNYFPRIEVLAEAKLGDVLRLWSGLGYNRRAKFLWQAAQLVVAEGRFPNDIAGLVVLPGVGVNTAGAIMAYAYNRPVVFIETNVRTVYIHHYFAGQSAVADAELRPIIERTLDSNNPRVFYWALMDYGSYLKRQVGNLNQLSKTYIKQSPFAGSQRQLRGQVIRRLTQRPYTAAELARSINDPRLPGVLATLQTEAMIVNRGDLYQLA